MLIDEARIILKAGHGGPGKVSFFPGKKAGPDGGNGGMGGDVYIAATPDIFALNQFTHKKELTAENGQPGDRNRKTGRNGSDLIVRLPVGTFIKDLDSGEEIEMGTEEKVVLVSKGGLGGKGNAELSSARNTTPLHAQKGLPGEMRHFDLQLKLIADIGLIGLPNAGKSSLLNELTAAHAKVANYPFTTLEPNLGVLSRKVIADIPGLIEGASSGKGLGIKFLKHIEKVGLLVHCISSESNDIETDYLTVIGELKQFNEDLAKKRQVILLTKHDLTEEVELKKKLAILKKFKKKILPVSIYDYDSLQKLQKLLQSNK